MRDRCLPSWNSCEMHAYDLLNEMGEAIEFCYFMNSGMTSILTIMGDGKGVEVGLTGKEGFIGLPVIVGLKTQSDPSHRADYGQRVSPECGTTSAGSGEVPAAGKKVESLLPGIGDAGHAGCCLQPVA